MFDEAVGIDAVHIAIGIVTFGIMIIIGFTEGVDSDDLDDLAHCDETG